jgi:hypothetical protein
MAQIFHPAFNSLAKASIIGAILLVGTIGAAAFSIDESDYVRDVGVAKAQPVPFSHEHHVRGLGIDCRYCHTSVEDSHFAGIPPTKTCMNCHSMMWTNAALLEPVRASFRDNKPLRWNRVHVLPDYVYFNHGIHIAKGVGCISCHGHVNLMPITYEAHALRMGWCLNCHRHPEEYLQPRDTVFNLDWTVENDTGNNGKPRYTSQEEMGKDLVVKYKVKKEELTNCSMCHR